VKNPEVREAKIVRRNTPPIINALPMVLVRVVSPGDPWLFSRNTSAA
jgi:hypothetical protein